MRFDALTTAVRHVWAKSQDSAGLGVLSHMLDVASVAEAILEREPKAALRWAAQAFGIQETEVVRWIAALVGLHDFGKATPGFQAKWPEGMAKDEAAGLPFSHTAMLQTFHDLASAALLRSKLNVVCCQSDWVRAVVQAVSAHHGYNFTSQRIKDGTPVAEQAIWGEMRHALFDHYWQTLSPQGCPQLEELALPSVEWLAGLSSVADWIGSNQEWFPLEERAATLEEHFACAKQLADKALDAIGWHKADTLLTITADTNALISRIVGKEALSARPLQSVADALLADGAGPALMIVEAPMGEGKTELAFLAHLRLQATNGHRGLYVALPTQATGNAMFERALTFLRAFAGDAQLDIQLAHGGSALNEQVMALRSVFGSEGPRSEAIASSTWFSKRRRALISPYGVGTVDQALLATLNVKHHFVRVWGLANRVIVLDEVHAYDTYTSGLIESLLRWLKPLGCSVVLMSATLPTQKRNRLLAAWDVAERDVPEMAYPRVIVADTKGIRGESFASRPMPLIAVSGIAEDLDAIAACVLGKLQNGGCGAVIVNTVDRAQKLYLQLKSQVGPDCELTLFHARYPADERRVHEQAVLRAFGKPGDGVSRPVRALLIATQVVEQSLDIDFDFMVSDLAPVDLLLQRAGRLHRHERELRPSQHADAQLIVAGLLIDRRPQLKTVGWGMYDAWIMLRTWAFITREPVFMLPNDIDRLVQKIYGDDELPDELSPEDREHIEIDAWGEHIAEQGELAKFAKNAAIDPRHEPHNAYIGKTPGDEDVSAFGVELRTRLGSEGVSVIPIYVIDDQWRLHPDGESFNPQAIPYDKVRELYARQLKLNRKGVVAVFKSIVPPESFEAQALLRDFKPLLLDANGCWLAKPMLRLDAELGIVYESTPKRELQ